MTSVRTLFACAFVFGCAAPAFAFPWTINHGYTNCTVCHVDPSGGTQLTAYGRGMSDAVVGWHADPTVLESGDVSPATAFLFGIFPTTPDWLNLSGNVRGGGGAVVSDLGGGNNTAAFPLVMALDARVTVNVENFIAHVSLGFGAKKIGPAVVISKDNGPDTALVSRDHWVGAKFLDEALVVRAGRMPLAFGLRNNEHTSFVRDQTFTDLNVDQQHGLAVYYGAETFRLEVMGIAGNFQLRPDAYRERGYSAYGEYVLAEKATVGISSLVATSARTVAANERNIRQAHGVFARYALSEHLTFLLEADALVQTAAATTIGEASWLQADIMPVQGVHIMPAFETLYINGGTDKLPKLGGWLSVAWYPLPHTEFRFDTVYRHAFPNVGASSGGLTALLQMHLFL
jgi:hypothetical protein